MQNGTRSNAYPMPAEFAIRKMRAHLRLQTEADLESMRLSARQGKANLNENTRGSSKQEMQTWIRLRESSLGAAVRTALGREGCKTQENCGL